jgi:hypothetical protein
MTIDEAAAALTEHGLDQRETVNLAQALSMFHARDVADERVDFGALMFTLGLVAGLDHGVRRCGPGRKAVRAALSADACRAI